MLEFAVELCELQRQASRGFLFEHPLTASSWGRECLKKLAAKSDVYTVKMDMCCFGMVSRDAQGEGLVRKTTQLLTNVTEVSDAMRRRCEGGHRHVHLISGRPAAAAEYPKEFCRSVLKAIGIWKLRSSYSRPSSAEAACLSLYDFARQDLCCPVEAAADTAANLGGTYVDDVIVVGDHKLV